MSALGWRGAIQADNTNHPSELWNSRISHINYKSLPHVRKVLTGLPDLKIDHEGNCKGCARGKNIKNPFLKSETKTKGTLELIHSDVCSPIPSTSLSGFEYYVTFIDDYSRKTWIYFLKTKDEVFEKFKEFKDLIEKHLERRIKTLKIDNGGEYTSKEFEAFCKEVGIKRERTTPYNPKKMVLQKERIGPLRKQ